MLLNMVMFKVTICDFRKININMTDKIGFFSNFSTKPHILYEGAIFLRKFNIKN